MHHSFWGYIPQVGEASRQRKNGVFIVKEDGLTTAYALYNLQEGGEMFVGHGVPVYEGMGF